MVPNDEAAARVERMFLERTERSLRSLFATAKKTNELEFAFALHPEVRHGGAPGWRASEEAIFAVEDYLAYFTSSRPSRARTRIALGFYSQLAAAAGFYEVPKNMLRVAEGLPAARRPFDQEIAVHRDLDGSMSRRAGAVMTDLIGHATALGRAELAGVFRDAFDPMLYDGHARADYVVLPDELRFASDTGVPQAIGLGEFERLLYRGVGFFARLFQITNEAMLAYGEPRTIRPKSDQDAEWTLHYDATTGTLAISERAPGTSSAPDREG